MSAPDPLPSVLILGASGMIGRNLVEFIISRGLASSVRAVDKRLPPRAFVSRRHLEFFQSPLVDFVQADLAEDEHVANAFRRPSGTPFDFVVCCAAETGFGRDEERYVKTVEIAAKCGRAAFETGARRFVYVSTGNVYKAEKSPATETSKLEPWTTPARYQLEAERELAKIAGLSYTILRPAITYGPGDEQGLMPRAVCAAAYTKLREKMLFLWGSEMRLNTVHVVDVCAAVWHALNRVDRPGTIYNLADKGASDQGKINGFLGAIFGIKTGFYGKLVSNIARMGLESAVEIANDKHLTPWLELLKQFEIEHTPLSPFIHIELLRQNHLSLDGSAIERTGFAYSVPELNRDALLDSINDHIAMRRFPPVVGAGEAPTGGAGTAAAAEEEEGE